MTGRPTANCVAAAASSSNAYRSGFDSTATVRSGTAADGSPRTCTTPSVMSRSSGSASRASPAMRSALARTFRAASAIALPLITAARDANVPTAYPNRRVSPVVTRTSSIGTPSSAAAICANTVSCPWPCEVSPVDTCTRPAVSTSTCPPSYGPTPVPST